MTNYTEREAKQNRDLLKELKVDLRRLGGAALVGLQPADYNLVRELGIVFGNSE